jgi:hypothetical protein
VIQLRILSGKEPGAIHTVRRFPCVLGRSAGASLRLEGPGIFDRHVEIDLRPAEGITLTVLDAALASVNGRPTRKELLRNGDLIDLGGVRVQFWLSQTRQHGLRLRELLTWSGFGLLCLLETAIVYALLR